MFVFQHHVFSNQKGEVSFLGRIKCVSTLQVMKIDETLQFVLVLYYIELPTNGETTETIVHTLHSRFLSVLNLIYNLRD